MKVPTGRSDGEPGRGAVAGEAIPDRVYVLDVDGQRIVIVVYALGSEAGFAQSLESMSFART